MIFASQVFLFWFLPAALVLYYAAPRRWKSLVLTLLSYVFYGWWRVDFLSLMLFSTVVDYVCGGSIARAGDRLTALASDDPQRAGLIRRRKTVLLISICVNLGLLAYFKYWNFGVDSLNVLLSGLGFESVTWTKVILPIGISFYTFQTMSYSIDVYRGHAPPVERFVDFACYVALFPQLVAGPIVRYETLADQLRARTHTFDKIARGAMLFQMGFCKKILLADTVAIVADGAYHLTDPTAAEAWLGTLAYAFQIYFDFSGYSDMAIGLGLLFGFTFPWNFDSPYKSKSITEFWRRWHISLSTWLRDYLYIPLGGNQKGPARTYVNLATTMLLGGLWHGAAWTYVAWGAYQGAWLAFERRLGKRSLYGALPAVARILLTFVIALFGWVFFRATDIGQASRFIIAMVGLGPSATGPMRFEIQTLHAMALCAAAAVVWLAPNSNHISERKPGLLWLLIALAFPIALGQLFFQSYSPFLYFQF